jgi:hypothetical protein
VATGSWLRRYGFATAYLGCFVAVELVYSQLNPAAQARLIAWASTDVTNLEHEPAGPLIVSAFVAPGYFVAWPVLIALALFGANRALGNARTALVCLAGHMMGSLVSEGIVAYRVDTGQLAAANRYLIDVGSSYVVVSAIVIAQACGTWLARGLAAIDAVLLVFPGHIFGGLSQLDVAAVGHLTAVLTAAAATALILARRGRVGQGRDRSRGPAGGSGGRPDTGSGGAPGAGSGGRPDAGSGGAPGEGSGGHVANGHAEQVGDRDGEGPEDQLPNRASPERPVG